MKKNCPSSWLFTGTKMCVHASLQSSLKCQ